MKPSTILDGNFDYLTNLVHWANGAHPLPASLYLDAKPAFFGLNDWPWIDPVGPVHVHLLPAKARYDGSFEGPPPPPVEPPSPARGPPANSSRPEKQSPAPVKPR